MIIKLLYLVVNLFFLAGILLSPYSTASKVLLYIVMSLILAFAFKRLSNEEGGEKDSAVNFTYTRSLPPAWLAPPLE